MKISKSDLTWLKVCQKTENNLSDTAGIKVESFFSDYLENFTQFSIAKASMGYAMSLSDHLSLVLESEGGFKVGSNPNNSLNFVLGGYGRSLVNNFSSFYGYDYISIIGDSYVKGVITLDLEFADNHHINFAANYANIQDDIFENENNSN